MSWVTERPVERTTPRLVQAAAAIAGVRSTILSLAGELEDKLHRLFRFFMISPFSSTA